MTKYLAEASLSSDTVSTLDCCIKAVASVINMVSTSADTRRAEGSNMPYNSLRALIEVNSIPRLSKVSRLSIDLGARLRRNTAVD